MDRGDSLSSVFYAVSYAALDIRFL